VETDRRLRGRGYPKNVPIRDAGQEHARVRAEIVSLLDSHKALLAGDSNASESTAVLENLNLFGTRHGGVLTFLGAVVTVVGTILGLLLAIFG